MGKLFNETLLDNDFVFKDIMLDSLKFVHVVMEKITFFFITAFRISLCSKAQCFPTDRSQGYLTAFSVLKFSTDKKKKK